MLPTLRGNRESREMVSPFERLFDTNLFNLENLFGSDLRKDDQGNMILEVDVPGFNENNLSISKDGYLLDVTGENDKGRKIERKMTLPTNTDDVKANVKDGVLEVTFYEKEGQQGNKQIPINSE